MRIVRKHVLVIIVPLLFLFFTPCARADDISLFEEGKRHFQTEQYYFATTWLERLLTTYPASPLRREALIIISRAYERSGRDQKAAHYLGILRKEFPDAANSIDADYRKLEQPVQLSTPAPPPVPAAPPAGAPSPSVKTVIIPTLTTIPGEPLKPDLSVPAQKSAPLLPVPEPLTAENVKPARIPVPIIKPRVPPPATPAVAPETPAPHEVSEPAPVVATTAPTPAPTAEKNVLELKNVFYTVSAGETVNRSNLNALLKKLKASGLQPAVHEGHKTMEVYRLATDCFSTKTAAQNRQASLARQVKIAFVAQDADRFCVVVASYFAQDAARNGQQNFMKKNLRTEIIKTQVILPSWKVTVGQYNDSQEAVATVKRLAELGINAAVVLQDK